MKFFLLKLCFLFFLLKIGFVLGQKNPEELKTKLNKATGTERIELLNELSSLVFENQPSYAKKLSEEALELAKQHPDNELLAKSYLYLANAKLQLSEHSSAMADYLAALNLFNHLNDDNFRAVCLNNMGALLQSHANYDKAKELFLLSLRIEERLGDTVGVAECLMNLGSLHYLKGEYQQSQKYYTQALKLHQKMNNESGIADCQLNLGVTYELLNKPSLALENLEKAESYFRQSGAINDLAFCLQNKGNLLVKAGDFKNALNYYGDAIDAAIQSEDIALQSLIYLNLGKAWQLQKRNDVALHHIQQAYDLAMEANDYKVQTQALLETAKILSGEKETAQAVQYAKRSLQMADSLGIISDAKEALAFLGFLYRTTGKMDEAFECYEKALLYADSLNKQFTDETLIFSEDSLNHETEIISEGLQTKSKVSSRKDALLIGLILTVAILLVIIIRLKKRR